MVNVVNVHSGAKSVRAYIKEQAALGLDHVKALIEADRDAIIAMTADVTEAEADFQPAEAEFSISKAVQHLNLSFERSQARLRAMTAGKDFVWNGPPARAGGLPGQPAASFAEARSQFIAGESELLSILDAATPGDHLDLLANHVEFGSMNWLEWATYSHHVHTHDHVDQIARLKTEIEDQRARDSR
ncbi:MAG: hypothetical protein HW416_2703 [Chloroflexi bacterium]|nr:hypothetical protein [Chloroflexota bacterium]